MDAKALHGLYSPLWEIAPDTKPKSITFDADESEQFVASFGTMHGNWHAVIVPVEVAADLCRVACEDRLRSDNVITLMPDDFDSDPENGGAVEVDGSYGGGRYCEGENVTVFSGPTIHHALVAAALAVAGGGVA